MEHPLAVADLLHSHGFDEEVVAAGLLHDVIEDTATDLPELSERFGPRVCALVREMTEDEAIPAYGDRKAEHRERVARHASVAAIYGADKLANTRKLEDEGQLAEERLDHYLATLAVLCESHPELPFLADLRDELERVSRRAPGSAQ